MVAGIAAGTPAPAPQGWSRAGDPIAQADAIERFDLRKRLVSYASDYFKPETKARIRVVEGDLRITGNLRLDWDQGLGADGMIVTGNLDVDGAIVNAGMNGGPFLLVAGTTAARAIVGGGAELRFEGDAKVAEIVIGHYNDGVLAFGADLVAPVVVTMDHDLQIHGRLDGRWFDVFNGDDEWSAFLDKDAGLAAMDEDEWHGLETIVIPRLLAGSRVLRAELPAKSAHPKYGRD